ncbi:8248_t:CDS:1 [Paraglomus occultum]|uniref:8248_t:CDS:1 n=1 Tax=Paraglomus occultum TaxID=144539 RepID=A0A9N9FGJ4_9GLOM|nr:8248_t:CDS:1 [Paraglomus occultum]
MPTAEMVSQRPLDISTIQNMENDVKWITHTNCAIHGPSCGGGFSRTVESSVYVIDIKNVNSFSEHFFDRFDGRAKRDLKSAFKGLFVSKSSTWKQQYIDIKFGESNVNQPITGGYYFMWVSDENGGTRTVIIAIAQITKSPAANHYFLKEYYAGNDYRLENALIIRI